LHGVEYKRGRPKRGLCDAVQLCAQALCLEEMLEAAVPAGFLFYGKTRRRLEVAFDAELRGYTEDLARKMHELFRAGQTPRAKYEKKCERCSLLQVCRPRAIGVRRSASTYLQRSIAEALADRGEA